MINIFLAELIQAHDNLIAAKDELRQALIKLRGANWQEGIKQDKRSSVKCLYAEFTATAEKIDKLTSTEIKYLDYEFEKLIDELNREEED